MTQHSAPDTRYSWLIRLLLAALLGFASEVNLWTAPTAPIASSARSIIDWALLALGYVALSALLLEIAARFRLRDVYGLLTLAGIYGILNGLILNPDSALIDVPRTLITRAMGAHAVAGIIALALFLALTRSGLRSRALWIAALVLAAVVGVAWGTWAHWSPVEFSTVEFNQRVASTLTEVILGAVIGIGVVALMLFASRRSDDSGDSPNLRLGSGGWAFTLIVLIGLLVLHFIRGEVDPLSLVIIVTLTVFSVMILWFQQRKKGTTLLDGVRTSPSALWQFLVIALVFLVAGMVGYQLPRGELGVDPSSDPLALIGALFTAYGLIWLPAVSIVLGARAFSKQARAMRL